MGFETTHLTQTLPTYTWLANHGITPSASATHTLSSLTSALKSESGVRRPSNNYVLPTYPFPQFYPALECQGHNLDSISWYFNLKGSAIDGKFVPIGNILTVFLDEY
jgi:ribonuclease T2